MTVLQEQREQVKKKEKMQVRIRSMKSGDMPEVLIIEAESFEFPWLEEDFVRCLRQDNGIGMVAEYKKRIVGFIIYESTGTWIHVLNLATASECRRRGVGSQMVAELIGELPVRRCTRITLLVRETNLPAQLFFHANGFRAVAVLRFYYGGTPEDAYVMEYRFRPETPAPVFRGTNRIVRLIG